MQAADNLMSVLPSKAALSRPITDVREVSTGTLSKAALTTVMWTFEAFGELALWTGLGGKCKFAASAQRLCQFANSGHPSVGHCILDAAAPHDGTEPTADIQVVTKVLSAMSNCGKYVTILKKRGRRDYFRLQLNFSFVKLIARSRTAALPIDQYAGAKSMKKFLMCSVAALSIAISAPATQAADF